MKPGDKLNGRQEQLAQAAIKNPYILNFCKVLIDKKGERLEPEARKKLVNDMYRLFENMLGQNMVKALPESVRQQYLDMCDDLSQLDYEKIGSIFDVHVQDHESVMKQTMKQFAEIYMINRNFDPKDYPVDPKMYSHGEKA